MGSRPQMGPGPRRTRIPYAGSTRIHSICAKMGTVGPNFALLKSLEIFGNFFGKFLKFSREFFGNLRKIFWYPFGKSLEVFLEIFGNFFGNFFWESLENFCL